MALSVVVAPDSFKGSLAAAPAARAIAAGWLSVRPGDDVRVAPQADGGEGTLDAIEAATPGSVRRSAGLVTGPDGRPTPGEWLLLDGGVAVVELAQCSGLPLMRKLDATGATSRGLGEVVRAALGSVGHGKDATEEALYVTVEKINSTLQTRINYLSVIGVCAPMIGLLGTVAGMKGAFGALGTSGADVGALAGHIGEVLVATATGLLVAIPAFGSFYFLRNKLQGGIHNLQDESERLFRNAPYEYLQNADVGQEETFAALPNWIEAPEA